MSELEILRYEICQLCSCIRDLSCCIPRGRVSTADYVGDRLDDIYERAKQIELELQRP